MLESQGLRPVDPYRTLQLHPRAPRQLVVEAYWRLIAREKGQMAAAAARRISELNAAYALLMDEASRRAYDEEHGLTSLEPPQIRVARKRFGVFGFGNTAVTVTGHSDYYHLLRVDREADSEIVGLAHAVLSRQVTGHSIEEIFLRDLLDEAHHTLSNPQLRAQYDGSSGRDAPVEAPAPPAPPAVEPSRDEDRSERALTRATTTASRAQPAGVAAMRLEPAPATAALPSNGADAPADVPRGEDARESEASRTALRPHRAEADTINAAPGGAQTPARHAAPTAAVTERPRGLLHRVRLGTQRTPGAAGTEDHARPRVRRADTADELSAAKDRRLLTLREAGEDATWTQPEAGHSGEGGEAAGAAQLVFVAGPLTGSCVPLGVQALTLGSSPAADVVLPGPAGRVAPEHARIWQHGDHFVFRQIASDSTAISGHQLLLPLVILDDGDDIQIGPHRMRFSSARASLG